MSKRPPRDNWSRKLPTPIEVGRRKLRTLHDLRAHLLELPESEHDKVGWRAASEAVLQAAESGDVPVRAVHSPRLARITMAQVTVYQFTNYDIASDQIIKSRRWGTREAIETIKANVIEDTAVDVDDSVLGQQVSGLSEIGFDPHALKGFQRQVKQ
jgi:hypothetical protein